MAIVGAAALIGLAAPSSDAAPVQIMALGDSITFGGDSSTGAGYRGPLQQMLTDAGVEYDFVGTNQNGPATFDGMAFDRDHEGYPGLEADRLNSNQNSAVESLKRQLDEGAVFADLSASGLAPDVILLHIGTNTVTRDTSSSDDDSNINSAHLQLGRLLDYLGTQIDQGFLSSNVSIIVARILPKISGNTHTARENTYIQTQNYNAAIDGIVNGSSIADRITLVDMFNGIEWGLDDDGDGLIDMPNGSYLDGDGVHPLDAGHAFMAQQWFDAMVSAGFIPNNGVPEPGAVALVLAGSLGLLVKRRRATPRNPG